MSSPVPPGHRPDPEDQLEQVQRLGAYVVCVRDGQVLLSQLSQNTPRPGAWNLPGGGVDHGEHPRDAVVREVYEETGLPVELGPLLDVDSIRVVPPERSRDYHGIRLIFVGWVTDRQPPRVIEVDGSTVASAWIDLDRIGAGEVDVTPLVPLGLQWLARHLDRSA